jgi:hypothetical protein
MLQGVNRAARKRQRLSAPNFLQGAKSCAQKCHSVPAPASYTGPKDVRRNAICPSPLHLYLGHTDCAKMSFRAHPRERPSMLHINVIRFPPLPTSYKRPCEIRRNAIAISPLGGRSNHAKVPYYARPRQFNRSRHDHAEMPKSERSKGRGNLPAQKCQTKFTLPNQLQGAIIE